MIFKYISTNKVDTSLSQSNNPFPLQPVGGARRGRAASDVRLVDGLLDARQSHHPRIRHRLAANILPRFQVHMTKDKCHIDFTLL